MDDSFATRARTLAWILVITLLALPVSCSHRQLRPPARLVWVMGAELPAFDPDGPPETLRWALEHELTRGLLAEDSTGAPVPDAAERVEVSPDSLTYTFRLETDLKFVDGSPCRSRDFAHALTAGLERTDHGTRAWQLAAVRGIDRLRPGKPLPELGIRTPDDQTLVLELAVRDSLFLRKLAVPGTTFAWKERAAPGWTAAIGLGPFRVARGDSLHGYVLVQSDPRLGPADTVAVRSMVAIARLRSMLRAGLPDLVWPLPPGFLSEEVPGEYQAAARPSLPARRLMLIQRADLPPTTRLPARSALVHGINDEEVVGALGSQGSPATTWIHGAEPFEFPRLDPGEIELWRERGNLGRSFHVSMVYDARGPAAEVARPMQGEWSANAIYVELVPLTGRKLLTEQLKGRSHVVLAAIQDLIDAPAGIMASIVMPLRGPAVGAVRSGWRTREFDAWIDPRARSQAIDLAGVQRRLLEERVALPLARLDWVWIERSGGPPAPFDPRFGPRCPAARATSPH